MKTDILVIGSGIAGLSTALKASRFANVLVVTKDKAEECNTNYAQGGLAAVFSKDDSYELHIKDTIRAGDGLCNKEAVGFVVKNAPKEIQWLIKEGVDFDRNNVRLALSKEAVHSKPRIVHAGDITGREVEKKLIKKIKYNKKIRLMEYYQVIELIVKEYRCYGAIVFNIKKNKIEYIFSKAVVLATGGLGRIYKNTCNPEVATGDGFALAYNAGADLQDMEFVQFHPTGLYDSDPTFLISETLRGEGGVLRNIHMQTYMEKYHRDGVLAPRDVVSKSSVVEMKRTKSNYVFLDISHKDSDYLKKRFPNINKECLKYRIDFTKQVIPVSPTAHYMCGGVKIDLQGKTTINGLYAIGEVSCSGLHGADRLASNSLIDCLVFSTSAADSIREYIKDKEISEVPIEKSHFKIFLNKKTTEPSKEQKESPDSESLSKVELGNKLMANSKKPINNDFFKIKKQLQNLMWEKVGIIRNEKGLKEALEKIIKWEKELELNKINKEIIELQDIITISKLIVIAALSRKESRGTHFIEEYPKRDDKNWIKRINMNKDFIQSFLKNA